LDSVFPERARALDASVFAEHVDVHPHARDREKQHRYTKPRRQDFAGRAEIFAGVQADDEMAQAWFAVWFFGGPGVNSTCSGGGCYRASRRLVLVLFGAVQ